MSLEIDKEWMIDVDRTSARYLGGVAQFLEFVVKYGGGFNKYLCPCNRCQNTSGMIDLPEITYHLFNNGIDQSYILWKYHGEKDLVEKASVKDIDESAAKSSGKNEEQNNHHRMEDLVDDAFEMHRFEGVDSLPDVSMRECDDDGSSKVHVDHVPDEMMKYKSLLAHAKEPLYPSCPEGITTLYAVVKLNSLKTQCGWSDNSVTLLLEFLREMLPKENTLPTKYPEMKAMIKEVGMDYECYDACVNDCILYRKEHANKVVCPTCNAPRYKIQLTPGEKAKKIPQKILRHFPLVPRLKKLYTIPWIANAMTWHFRAKSDLNVMRHPVDSSAWRSTNTKWPEFAVEPRNVRLGLATDGFNPFGSLSSNYSCWPVIVVPYNLPPSMCMKREFSILTLLIPGPKAPSKDIDVYLEPLVDELKQLWYEGAVAYDAFTKSNFTLKAMLLWAIHDFPAYGTLSGCITRGYKAYPICGEDTESSYLPHSKKMCYMGHRKFLPKRHKFRDDKINFNNEVEHRSAPRALLGRMVQQKVANIKMKTGKAKLPVSRKRKFQNEDADDEQLFETDNSAYYRRSILFDLPYWEEHDVRHNLDVMHVVKNVSEHILNTILDTKDRTKDGLNARKDLEAMGIKPKLWLTEDANGKTKKSTATFILEKDENKNFFTTLKNLKGPKMFSSNFRNKVSLQPFELKNFKSHDYHVVLQHLLPMLLQHAYSKNKDLGRAIHQISLFFKVLCAKVLNRDHLLKAKACLIEAMCVLEKYFPPAFFDISIHLMVHLADEALICGPVRYRWMYFAERLMKIYKGYVRNMRYIEGSIAEAYIIEEASLYCMEYMQDAGDGTHKHTRETFLDEDDECADEAPLSNGKDVLLTQVQFEQIRRWALDKYDGIEEWRKKYDLYRNQVYNGSTQKGAAPKQVQGFLPWLREELLKTNDVDKTLWRLIHGPKFEARSYTKYCANGFVFSPSEHEAHMVTQDSGVSMRAITQFRASPSDTNYKEAITTYYGVVRQILELDYVDFSLAGFYCDWVKVEDKTNGCKIDPNSNLIMVNLKKLKSKSKIDDEPFILASKASQVFYSDNLRNDGWHVVLHTPKRLTTKVDDIEFPTEYQSAFEDNEKLEELTKCMG